MLLKVKIVSILALLILVSCNTINYKFSEKVSYNDRLTFLEKIKENNPFGNNKVKLSGIYTERNKSYKFEAFYDFKENKLILKLFSILNKDLIFEARYEDNETYYDFFVQSFFSVKIGIMLKSFIYILKIIPDEFDLYLTNDDYYVIVDSEKNYQKYDSYNIIKKENRFQIVKYYYENNMIKRIEYKKDQNIAIIIIEELEKYE
ncbi:MAG TPA: hypothetical protein PLD75_09905 [Spirochaetota bacterium]|nr:hypothetical protein [Spirochaetota bacterium]